MYSGARAGLRQWYPELLLGAFLLATRLAWIFWIGPDRVASPDQTEYLALASRIKEGNFDLSLYRFIRPPGLPTLIALLQLGLGDSWETGLRAMNLAFDLGTGAMVYHTAAFSSGDHVRARLALALFCLHLPLMAFSAGVSSEPPALFFGLVALYLFFRFLRAPEVAGGAMFGSVAYLACAFRPVILGSLPVFALYAFLKSRSTRGAFGAATAALAAFSLLALPFGLYNLRRHGEFILSSNAGSFMFLNANSEVGYLDAVRYSRLNPEEQYYVKNFSEYGDRFFGKSYDAALALPETEKQAAFRRIALDWIRANPGKFLEAKLSNFTRVLLPGLSFQHTAWIPWLLSFLIGLPLYLLAYYGLYLGVRRRATPDSALLLWAGLLAVNACLLVLFLYTYRYKAFGYEYLLLFPGAEGAQALLARTGPRRAGSMLPFP